MRKLFKSIIVKILTWEASMVLRRYKPEVIVVTGSVGKTSTKDAIYCVLKDSTSVRKSQKSFNSELGIPLTVLGLDNAWGNPILWTWNILRGLSLLIIPHAYPKLLVLEVGADHPGDIRSATRWLKPDIAVITRLPEHPVHVEYFSSPEEVRKEKAEAVHTLGDRGIFIANGDDDYVRDLRTKTKARTITYGVEAGAQVRGSYVRVDYEEAGGKKHPVGMLLRVDWEGNSFPVRLSGVLGIQPCMAALAALAVGIARGESVLRMSEALATLEAPRGRMRVLPGASGSIIIDDTYNSSPVAVLAALDTLKSLEGTRKIAMLGDMLELGEFSVKEHERIGIAASAVVDELVTVGKRAHIIADAAIAAGLAEKHIHQFSSSTEAGDWALTNITAGDIILAKGSQGSGANMIRMERAVKKILREPRDAKHLLVRQEKEWQAQYK